MLNDFDVRKEFPVLVNNPDITYLDSACTSLKPKAVIEAEVKYYTEIGACGGRSSHKLGRKTSEIIELAREQVANFVGGNAEGLVWTRNATESLNLVANSLDFSKRKHVVTTLMEHHSVLLPFMKLKDEGRIDLKIVNCDRQGQSHSEDWKRMITKDTALVVTHSWNNTTGTGRDVNELAKIAHDNGALICIDGAQGVPHHKTQFKNDNIDFLCFSAHKMLGPTGIGALLTKKEQLKGMKTFMTGGGTVKTVEMGKVVQMDDQTRFEAGIQNYAGIFGFGAACEYLKKTGMEKIEEHERMLARLMFQELENAGAIVYGPKSNEHHGSLYSFNMPNAKPHDVALMLDKEGIAVRSGLFCAQPAMETIGAKGGAVRASGYIYNNKDDIRKLGEALAKIVELYK